MKEVHSKEAFLCKIKAMKPNLAATAKTPRVSRMASEPLSHLSTKDVDDFEMEVLRRFYIETSRKVPFEFAAYPEDRANNDDKNFKPLHYHLVIRVENVKKFMKVAPKQYEKVLRNAYGAAFQNIEMPNFPFWCAEIDRTDPEKSYEEYILKHYHPSIRLVNHEDFKEKRAIRSHK